jgi:uncharacterized protein YaaQ
LPQNLGPNPKAGPGPAQNPDIVSHPIKYLMTAVVQFQDLDNAIQALTNCGIFAKALASTGGFLGRRNATLLIGLAEDQREHAVLALGKGCRRRVEYLVTPLEGSPFSLPLSTPVSVGGATIFTLAVERYEEF